MVCIIWSYSSFAYNFLWNVHCVKWWKLSVALIFLQVGKLEDRQRKTDRERERRTERKWEKRGLVEKGVSCDAKQAVKYQPRLPRSFQTDLACVTAGLRLPRGHRPNSPIHADLYKVSELVPESWNHLESSGNLQQTKLSLYTSLSSDTLAKIRIKTHDLVFAARQNV